MLQRYTVPGPDLPLLEYYHSNYRLDEIDVFEMSRGLYRAAVRCYAVRLYPLEVVSVDRWEFARSQMYEPVLFRFVAAKCARIRSSQTETRLDPWVTLEIFMIRKGCGVSRKGWEFVPKFDIVNGWWEPHNDNAQPPDVTATEMSLYKMMVAQTFCMWDSMSFLRGSHAQLQKLPVRMIVPDFTRQFTAPHPGAIVQVPAGEHGWVLRGTGEGMLAVEVEQDGVLEERTYHQSQVEVLG